MELRPYQVAALNEIKSNLRNGVTNQLLSMATGVGKTCIFSSLPEYIKNELPGQTMVLIHRDELASQAIDKMRIINPNLTISKEKAESFADPNSDVIIASVQTLGRKGTKRVNRFNWDSITKVVCDEAHHSTADSYKRIFDIANVYNGGSGKLLLGVTATPVRSDGKALAQIYKKVVYTYGIRQAIEDGWLVDVLGFRVNTKVSLDQIKILGGDFNEGELADAVNNPYRNQLIVKAWLDKGENRQTVAFCVDIQHSKDLAEMFRQNGVKAEAVWGDDPDRSEKLKAHRNGEITILTNCGVLTEGYDDWRIGCIILARPTKSGVLYTQMIGRGTRLQDGTGNLIEYCTMRDLHGTDGCLIKKDVIVIDVVDVSSKHSLITLPTLMGMSTGLDLKGKSVVKSIQSIEAAQGKYSHVDFSGLKDITQIESYIESVDFFNIKFPEVVMDNSKFGWHTDADGSGLIILIDNEPVRIRQNLLDKYEITAILKGQRYRGERDTIEEAILAADGLIYDKAPEFTKLINRNEKWHSDPPTQKQLDLLAKLYKNKALPNNLTKGQASQIIDSFFAKKQK